jgi:hypothetical protein
LTADFDFMADFAQKNERLLALTECGLKNVPDSTWYTRVLQPVMSRYPICYFLLWRNAKHEYFAPSPELPCAADFQKMVADERVLMLKDIAK